MLVRGRIGPSKVLNSLLPRLQVTAGRRMQAWVAPLNLSSARDTRQLEDRLSDDRLVPPTALSMPGRVLSDGKEELIPHRPPGEDRILEPRMSSVNRTPGYVLLPRSHATTFADESGASAPLTEA